MRLSWSDVLKAASDPRQLVAVRKAKPGTAGPPVQMHVKAALVVVEDTLHGGLNRRAVDAGTDAHVGKIPLVFEPEVSGQKNQGPCPRGVCEAAVGEADPFASEGVRRRKSLCIWQKSLPVSRMCGEFTP